jgi:hypothetical protein
LPSAQAIVEWATFQWFDHLWWCHSNTLLTTSIVHHTQSKPSVVFPLSIFPIAAKCYVSLLVKVFPFTISKPNTYLFHLLIKQ